MAIARLSAIEARDLDIQDSTKELKRVNDTCRVSGTHQDYPHRCWKNHRI